MKKIHLLDEKPDQNQILVVRNKDIHNDHRPSKQEMVPRVEVDSADRVPL